MTSTFHWFHHSKTATTPVKYEPDIQYLNSMFPLKKWENNGMEQHDLATPTAGAPFTNMDQL